MKDERAVTLLRYVEINGVWKRVRVEPKRQGRGRGTTWVDSAVYRKMGQYQLRWYLPGNKAEYVSVGIDGGLTWIPEGAHAAHLFHGMWRGAGVNVDAEYPPDSLYEIFKRKYLQRGTAR